jgi:hypothetical protein
LARAAQGRARRASKPEPEAATGDELICWTEQSDVIAVVEDLADEGLRPGKISRTLGLSRAEVVTILRRTGR